MKRPVFLLLILPILLVSCSLEQRHYRSGFYIDRNRNTSAEASRTVKNLRSADAELASNAEPATICEASPAASEITATTAPACHTSSHEEFCIIHDYRESMNLPLHKTIEQSSVYKDTIYVKGAAPQNRMLHPDIKTARQLMYAGIILTFVTFLGFICIPLAMFYARRALREIQAQPNKYYGERDAQRILMTSTIMLILSLAVVAAVIVVLTVL